MVFSLPSFNNYPYLSNLVQLYPTYSTAAIILKQISYIISFPLIGIFKSLFHFSSGLSTFHDLQEFFSIYSGHMLFFTFVRYMYFKHLPLYCLSFSSLNGVF